MQYIGLVDCDNFFVSCERLFRPNLQNKPVLVLSSNDGCVVARSQEVKDMGIAMGAPYFMVKALCKKEGVTVFSSNFPLYRDISSRVMTILRHHLENLEIYSADEAFFTISRDASLSTLFDLKERILREVGIPVSIGAGDTKTITKYASEIAKKEDGICVFPLSEWQKEAKNVSCGALWGVGRNIAAKLNKAHIFSAHDIMETTPSVLKMLFGVEGQRLWHELNGTPMYTPTGNATHIRKSMIHSRSFEHETKILSVLESAIGYHIFHAAKKLRREGLVASRVGIVIGTSRHGNYALKSRHVAVDLVSPTNDTAVLMKEAQKILREAYEVGIPYKRAGVSLGGLFPSVYASMGLFDQKKHTPDVNDVVDKINEKHGSTVVKNAVIRGTDMFAPSAKQKSKQYTTSWGQIAKVKAI